MHPRLETYSRILRILARTSLEDYFTIRPSEFMTERQCEICRDEVAKYHCDVLDVLLFGFPPKNPEAMTRMFHVCHEGLSIYQEDLRREMDDETLSRIHYELSRVRKSI